ncbi:hypothetical protein PR202_gb06410 [Eleusine coracana subsp. coracana]|uniref:Uncharacterized protein n=1 Tax=Eleusine coracana subsp. coracana TaxID=191504 RepID=A0AAV5E9K4_ELECO|nr:hypothetical protein PR202_gb06410 [Eleusine coracana subsp. coracana]
MAAAASTDNTTSYVLVGPPEARHAHAAARATDAAATTAAEPSFNKPATNGGGNGSKTLTENLSPTFVSSGDPCLDFFFHVVPGTPSSTVSSLLASAWAADPATALRLVGNLRGVRGSGKSDREGFYAAALWLHDRHPRTLALNARHVAGLGYLKDLPELLHRLVHGGKSTRTPGRKARRAAAAEGWFRTGGRKQRTETAHATSGTTEERVAASLARDRGLAETAAAARRARRAESARRAVEMYNDDPAYRFLHDRTADLFAELLAEDTRKLAAGETRDLSLAAKWCPSLDSSYDRSTLLCEAVARRLFPKSEFEDIPDAHYAYRARERLRKAALVPLRRALKLPEVFISGRAWGDVSYTRVASVAMKNYRDLFLKHDGDRFNAYLADVKSGKKKIAAGALLPHEIIASLSDDSSSSDENTTLVAELQWQRMVDDMRLVSTLSSCVAVCDVSGSMYGAPMDVSVALGLLVSELSADPWRGRVITFSDAPQLHTITGDTLSDKVEFVKTMDWGMNTDFQAVFDRILEVAVEARLPPEKMVRRVLVFSDMEFDVASANPWETDYEAIVRKFADAGYGDVVPEIVFWNLRDSKSVPVEAGQKGVALVSGFSKNLLKLFLDGGGIVSPRAVMEKAIARKEYQELAVLD